MNSRDDTAPRRPSWLRCPRFMRLGEALHPEAVGDLVRRFEELVQENTTPAARHVKTVGDAAMLVSDNPEALLDGAGRLVAAAEASDGRMPRIHAGGHLEQ